MLDLDFLAESRARSLNQAEEAWREAIWSSDFQEISQHMSDGEVESFVAICCSQEQLRAVVRHLLETLQSSSQSPYAYLTERAAAEGLSLADWLKSKFPPGA